MLLPPPPYRLLEATAPGFGISAPVVEGNRLFTVLDGNVLAYSLPSLRPTWKRRLSDGTLALSGDHLVFCGRGTNLVDLDVRTGRVRWTLPHHGPPSAMAMRGDTLFVSLDNYVLTALDLKTRRPVWSRRLSEKRATDYVSGAFESLSLVGTTLIGSFDETFFALDAATGRVLWTEEKTYHIGPEDRPFPVSNGLVWLDSVNGGSKALDVRTGAVRWRNPKVGAAYVALTWQGRFVSADSGTVTALDPRTGRVLWSHRTGDEHVSIAGPASGALGDVLFAHGSDRWLRIDPKGKAQPWVATLPGRPLWSDARNIVAYDGDRFLRYVRLASAPTALSPSAEAAQLAARFSRLDDEGRARLVRLGHAAFPPLLSALRKASAERDRLRGNDRYRPEGRARELDRTIEKIVSRADLPLLLRALREIPPGAYVRRDLLGYVRKVAPSDVVAKTMVAAAHAAAPYAEEEWLVWDTLLKSRDRVAVGFVIRTLKDPKADPRLRARAYRHVAETGGEAGLRAVLAVTPRRHPLPDLAKRLSNAGVTVLRTRTNPQTGRSQALVKSGILGAEDDLFVAEGTPGYWASAIFTGRSERSLPKGEWPPVPTEDADGDGLTDIVEARLGTDPHRKDTDGDGDPDASDPCPNAARRPQTDAERVLAAAVAARVFDLVPTAGCLVLPEGATPFEIDGYPGPLVWRRPDAAFVPDYGPFERRLNFAPLDKSAVGLDRFVVWNRDRSVARVMVESLNDGYSAAVRELGGRWVVMRMEMSWIQ